MKNQLSSLDLYYLTKELQVLDKGRLQRVVQGEGFIYFEFWITAKGKTGLMVRFPSFVYLSGERPSGRPHGFAQYLMKYFGNSGCVKIEQVGLERILCLDFSTKSGKLQLFIELFAKGNVVVCKEGVVQQALVSRVWKKRVIKRGEMYSLPPARLNILEVSKKDFLTHFENRKDETVSSILAVDFGLGGAYAEEICLRAKVDVKEKHVDVEKIYAVVQGILKEKLAPCLVTEDDMIVDVTPFSFVKYKGKKQEKLESFHSGIAQAAAVNEVKVSPYAKKIKKMQAIVEQQQKQLDKVEQEIQVNTFIGDAIYGHYKEIDTVLTYIQAKEKSWEEMKKELKKVKFITSIDEKKGKLVVEFERPL